MACDAESTYVKQGKVGVKMPKGYRIRDDAVAKIYLGSQDGAPISGMQDRAPCPFCIAPGGEVISKARLDMFRDHSRVTAAIRLPKGSVA